MPISKPASGHRDGSQEKPRRGVFLGGPLSAMLLSLCFFDHDGTLERTIPWFGLLPLFISLERHRRNLKWRLLHGLFFGLITCCWQLQTAKEKIFTPSTALLETAVAILLVTGSWMLFCTAGGALLRHRSHLAVIPGLAVLWTGIEFLRTEWFPLAMPWMQLGQALKPTNPESGAAAVVGLAGIGFLICLVNSAFFLALREKRGAVQFLYTLSGILAVVGLLGAGRACTDRPAPATTTAVGLVQTAEGENRKHLHLARQLSSSKPQLILFPADSFIAEAGRHARLKEDLCSFARTEKIPIVAGIASQPGGSGKQTPENKSSVFHIGRDGAVIAHFERGETGEEALLLEIEDTPIALVSDRVQHSAILMRSLAARGARLFLIAGDSETSSQGVYNHLRIRLQAFRAMETGTWICRAARSGVSAICNDRGSVVAQAPQGLAWATVNSVPFRPDAIGASHYASWGWYLGPGCLVLLAVLLFAGLYRRARSD